MFLVEDFGALFGQVIIMYIHGIMAAKNRFQTIAHDDRGICGSGFVDPCKITGKTRFKEESSFTDSVMTSREKDYEVVLKRPSRSKSVRMYS